MVVYVTKGVDRPVRSEGEIKNDRFFPSQPSSLTEERFGYAVGRDCFLDLDEAKAKMKAEKLINRLTKK